MSENDLLMQIQADALGIPVLRPSMLETTALGAALVGKITSHSSVGWYMNVSDSLLKKNNIDYFSWPSRRCRLMGKSDRSHTERDFISSTSCYARQIFARINGGIKRGSIFQMERCSQPDIRLEKGKIRETNDATTANLCFVARCHLRVFDLFDFESSRILKALIIEQNCNSLSWHTLVNASKALRNTIFFPFSSLVNLEQTKNWEPGNDVLVACSDN